MFPAHAEDEEKVVGSWVGTAISTTVPLPPLKTLMTFTREGAVLEARRLYVANSPLGPLLATPAHGEWIRTGNREFAATILLIYQGAENHPTSPGEVLAQEKVRFKLTLDRGGNQLSGVLLVEIRDVQDNLVFAGPGTYEGTRIEVEPLP
jgi:hypothetical protein